MAEFSYEDQERVKAWLRGLRNPGDGKKGLSSYAIRDLLLPYAGEGGISQPTVNREINAMARGEDLKKSMMRAGVALISFQEAEAQPAAEATTAVDSKESADTKGTPADALAATQEKPPGPELDQRRTAVNDLLKDVLARQRQRGILSKADADALILPGDTEFHLKKLQPFEYKSEGAEKVAFAYPGDRIQGWRVGYLTEGVDPTQRMQEWALPADASRDCMIGRRRANLVTVRPYPDNDWFWAHLQVLVDEWRELLKRFEPWITDGILECPSKDDAAEYERLLRLTARMRSLTLVYEGPAPEVDADTVDATVEALHFKIRKGKDKKNVLLGLGMVGILSLTALLLHMIVPPGEQRHL